MRLLPLSQAAGLVLARDVLHPQRLGMSLLGAGATLTAGHVGALARAGLVAAWVEDDLSEGLAPMPAVPDPVLSAAARAIAEVQQRARAVVQRGALLPVAVVAEVGRAAQSLVEALRLQTPVGAPLTSAWGKAEYLTRHPVGSAVVAVLIAREELERVGFHDWRRTGRGWAREERLVRLATAVLLQDLGMLTLPHAVLHEGARLTEADLAAVRRHPECGAEAVGGETTSAVVRGHHERWDGSGYPDGLAGDAIHPYARIAAVADVFDAMTSERCYAPAQPQAVAVQAIRDGAGTQFDPAVAEAFAAVVPPHPVGSTVTLPDGREAVVAAFDPAAPTALTVRVRQDRGVATETVRLGPGAAQAA